MSNLTSTLTLRLVDDGLAAKAKADAEALKKLAGTEKDLKRLSGARPGLQQLNERLDALAKHGERLDKFKAGAKNVRDLGTASRKARTDVAATAKAVASLTEGGDPKKLAAATRAHEKALKRRSKAHDDFADALRAQRDARRDALGGRGSSIAAAEARIAAETHTANAALREQLALVQRLAAKGAAERGLAGGMGGAGRAQLAQIEAQRAREVAAAQANRRLKEGMGGGGLPPVIPVGGHPEEPEPRRRRRGGAAEGEEPRPRGSGGRGGISAAGVLGTHELLKLGAGFTAYEAVRETYKAQAHRRHEEVRDRASGMSDAEVREGEERAAELSGKYRAFSQTEIMHSLRNARSIMGNWHEAQQVMDPMLKLRTVALGAHPEKREELEADFDKLIKGMEIKGVTQDMGKFTQYMDGMAKALNVFGDTLRPTDYYEMFKYGRQSTQGLSQDYMNTVAPTIAQELGGSSGGVAHAAFFRAIVGGKMANNAAEALMHIGLLDMDDLIINKAGSVKGIKPGHRVKGADEAQSNPYEWVQDYLVPALEKHGLSSPERMQETIGHIFSNQVAAQLVSLFATQQSRIEKDKALVAGAGGLEEAKRFQSQDPHVALQSVFAQAENLAAAIGGFGSAAEALNTASQGLASATQSVRQFYSRAAAAQAEHEAARKRGEDLMLAPSNVAKLNDLLGDPDGNTSPEMAQARQEKLQRDAIDARRAELDKQQAEYQGRLDQFTNGNFLQRGALRAYGFTPEGLQGNIDSVKAQRAALDAAVAAVDETREKLDDATMARQGHDVRFGQRNAGQAVNPVGAFGLHGAAGMDAAPQFGDAPQAPRGPVAMPLPPSRPSGLAGTAPQQLNDLKDVLGGGGNALNPTIVPKVDTSQLETVKPKADEAKGAVEAVGSVTAKPTVDTSSIAAATAQAQMLLSVLQSIPGAAGAAVAAANGAAGAAGTLRARASARASFSDGVTPGAGAE